MRSDQQTSRTGGEAVVQQLLSEGASLGFCVPGESYLPVIDALRQERERFALVTCRHEATAAHMAEASGKLTGNPGICFVTRGPGAMQAAVGVHTASQDSTPMLLFIGQAPTDVRGREAFQEMDYDAVFGTVAKWTVEITDADRIPELVSRAYHTAIAGRPGPVIVSLPEDVLWASTSQATWARGLAHPPAADVRDISCLGDLLRTSQRPIVLLGGSVWDTEHKKRVEHLARTSGIAVATAFRRQDYFDNRHPQYVGNIGLPWNGRLADRVAASDLVIALGPRLDSMTTRDYTLLSPTRAADCLVHVHPNAGAGATVLPTRLAIPVSAPAIVDRLGEVLEDNARSSWRHWSEAGREEYDEWTGTGPTDVRVDLATIVRNVREQSADADIFTNGAGRYTAWVHRYLEYRDHGTQLAPISGSMGYGVPAAVAACVTRPDVRAVAFAGDGCFQMAAHELATAVEADLAPIVVVFNDRMLGAIRMHQDARFPGRPYATSLQNPDFVALAQAYGAHAERVERTDDFASAFARARAAGRAAVVEVVVPDDQPAAPPAWAGDVSG